MSGGQLTIDFEYDERVVMLSRELALMLAPHAVLSKEGLKILSERMALLAQKRFKDAWEPKEEIRCHTCDNMTTPDNRVRVVVCSRCSFEGRSPGASG